MKKCSVLLLLVFIISCLSGCGEEEFSYDKTLQQLINKDINDSSLFEDDVLDEALAPYSISYRNLIHKVYDDLSYSLASTDEYSVTLDFIYWDYDAVYNTVTQDVSGFVADLHNLQDLGMSQADLDNYVYDYLNLLILQSNKKARGIVCELTQIKQEPFIFSTNEPIVTQLIKDTNQLVYDLEAFAFSYEDVDTATTSDAQINVIDINVGEYKVINYEGTPISITVTNIWQGEDAKTKLLELSANNEALLSDNLVVLEYEVYNFSNEVITFRSKFYNADLDSGDLFDDDLKFIGINDVCNIEPCSSIIVRDAIVFTHDDLVWYDGQTFELYLLNLE